MSHVVTSALIDAVWSGLHQPVPSPILTDEARQVISLTTDPWIDCFRVSKLVADQDSRLWGIDILRLARALSYPTPTIFKSVGLKSDCAWMGQGRLHRTDAAAVMIGIERLNFRVDPTAVVEAILPSVRDLPQVTLGEMAVLDFHTLRHRGAPIMLMRQGCEDQRGRRKKTTTPGGYKVAAEFHQDVLVRLEVGAPNFKRPSARFDGHLQRQLLPRVTADL